MVLLGTRIEPVVVGRSATTGTRSTPTIGKFVGWIRNVRVGTIVVAAKVYFSSWCEGGGRAEDEETIARTIASRTLVAAEAFWFESIQEVAANSWSAEYLHKSSFSFLHTTLLRGFVALGSNHEDYAPHMVNGGSNFTTRKVTLFWSTNIHLDESRPGREPRQRQEGCVSQPRQIFFTPGVTASNPLSSHGTARAQMFGTHGDGETLFMIEVLVMLQWSLQHRSCCYKPSSGGR